MAYSEQRDGPASRRKAAPGARNRRSDPQSIQALPPYDVRVRREMAQRRTLLALVRQFVRLVVLHALDALIAAGTALAVLRFVSAPSGLRMVGALTGLMLIGLNSRGAYQAGDARRDPRRIPSGAAIAFPAIALISSLSIIELG